MKQITTISEFLLQAGTEYRVFDMGRTIRKVSSQVFLDYENATTAPPYPRAQNAWFGLLFWNKNMSNQHYIWFVKLPLDEQGLIMPAARNHYLQLIVDALGKQLEHAESKNGQLPENPYSFVPNQHQLADFNSISRRSLKLGQSDYYQVATSYLKQPSVMDWQQVPLQGLTDVAALFADKAMQSLLCEQFSQLAQPVQFSLLTSLENQMVSIKFAETLSSWLDAHSDNPLIWQHGLRALAQSPCAGLVKQLLEQVFSTGLAGSADLLTVIAGRLWHHFDDEMLLRQFMQAIAELDMKNPDIASNLFAPVYRDLVQIPMLRNALLGMLRWPDKSPELTLCVGKLFSGQS